jgi:Ca-activated chloride channel homolog
VPAPLRAVLVAVGLVAVVGLVWTGVAGLNGAGCGGQVRVTVAAAPEISSAIDALAKQWVATAPEAGGECVAVEVQAQAPVEVAAAIAGRQGVALPGVGQSGADVRVPEVWVPDSTTWLTRLQAAAAGLVPTSGQALARSAVVLAMPEPVAQRLGWPDRRLSYPDVLEVLTEDTAVHAGIVDPSRDAGGLAGVLALSRAASAAGDGPAQTTDAVLRTLAVGNSTVQQDLLNKFPRQADATSLASAKVTVAPLPEQAVVAYNAGRPPVRLAAFYLDPEPPPLDYPFVAMPGLDGEQSAAAAGLQRILAGSGFRERLAAQGLRAADGTPGPGFAAPRGAPPDVTPTPTSGTAGGTGSGGDGSGVPDPAAVRDALARWSRATTRT